MNEPEGFFPQRAVLAARRERVRADPEPASAAKQAQAVWILCACFSPIWMSSLFQVLGAFIRPGHVPVALYAVMYLLAAFALGGIAFGIWRGLHLRKLSQFDYGQS